MNTVEEFARLAVARKGIDMMNRFIRTLGLAVAWSMFSLAGVTMGWILLGAAVIGILGTIGYEPPPRRASPVPDLILA